MLRLISACVIATLALGAALAQPGSSRISGTGTSYWVNRDPHTGQNQSALMLRSDGGASTLVMKCLPDGEMMMYVTTPVPALPQENAFTLRKRIGALYRAEVQVGSAVLRSAVQPIGYDPVQTGALRLDDAVAAKMYSALYGGTRVAVRLIAVSKAALNAQTVAGTYDFAPQGFQEALEEIDYCDMG
ncbi:hypothetical protein [Deinococcus hopiensis]|uniref:Uncharacterized protein n=1 Tax=Deinococcus hopiensis KR-140 TaxID=695939 RepID=A0A1W1URH3_9DEIO|nr:hypothetical protein [Deinococcus hopiensis]SMB83411.1 hypothetical protein SAMN00790413_04427 [Deinococcus hopiensis KR-140]